MDQSCNRIDGWGIGFRTTSAGVHFDDAVVSLLNKAPEEIALSHNSVVENTTAGGMVGTFSTSDPDAEETFSYMLIAGAGDVDNGSFTISDNKLFLAVTPDYEAKDSYSIRVRSTDSGGLYVEKTFTIHVTDVNEPPVNPDPTVIVFSDDFEDGNAGGWTSASGSWDVTTDGTKALIQNQAATAVIAAGDSWTDYTYEAKAKMPITNANAGILFRVQDAGNFYMFRIHSAAQKLELYKSVDNVMTLVSSTPFTAQANQWYTMKASIEGNTIKVMWMEN